MDVIVIGAGIVGLASAWYLRADGHQVTLLEAREGVGLGASFANGGQLSYRYIAPLADPEVLAKLPAWMLRGDAPVRFSPTFDPRQWRWILDFLKACNPRDRSDSVAALLPLSLYSRKLVNELVASGEFEFGWRRNGKLVVYRDARSFDSARRLLDGAPELGDQQFVLDPAGCLAVEPALARMRPWIAGGIHTPDEEVGDCLALCRAFERGMTNGDRPIRLMLSERVERIESGSGRFRAVITERNRIAGEACVVASGVDAAGLLGNMGIRVPIYPLKGYSIGVPVRDPRRLPDASITDYERKIVYARIGDRLRVAGLADIGGYDDSVSPARIATLVSETRENFGDGLDLASIAPWAGLRPATPTGRPLVCESPLAGLWLNLGHGALGFTLAAGCARVLADRLGGRPPAVPDRAFALGRRR